MTDDLLQRLAESLDPEPDPAVGGRGLRARIPAPRDGGSPVGSAPVVTTDSAGRKPAEDAADLYVGERYLGTLLDLGSLCDLTDVFEAGPSGEYDEAEFERRVGAILRRRDDAVPAWPWASVDSCSTPWAYVYRANSVQVYRLGRLYGVVYPSFRRARHRPARSSPFPTMIDATEGDENAE